MSSVNRMQWACFSCLFPPSTHSPPPLNLEPHHQDACLRAPWQPAGARPAYQTRTVQISAFGELQRYVDEAAGPTVLLVRASQPLTASATLVIGKPDLIITAAASFSPEGAPFEGQPIKVACGGGAKTLVAIK